MRILELKIILIFQITFFDCSYSNSLHSKNYHNRVFFFSMSFNSSSFSCQRKSHINIRISKSTYCQLRKSVRALSMLMRKWCAANWYNWKWGLWNIVSIEFGFHEKKREHFPQQTFLFSIFNSNGWRRRTTILKNLHNAWLTIRTPAICMEEKNFFTI